MTATEKAARKMAKWNLKLVEFRARDEALARVAAAEQPAARVRVVRPPKLLTEVVNTPLGRQDALAPEDYAARLVRRLLDPGEIPVDGVMDLG